MLKDRLYTKAPNSKSRRSAQTAVWKITSALIRLMTPILVFTAEELWTYLPKVVGEPDSVHISTFPAEEELRTGLPADRLAVWELLGRVRGEVLKALEVARNEKKLVNSGLEARILLNADPELKAKLKNYLPQLPGLFIVSQVKLIDAGNGDFVSEAVPSLEVTVQRAPKARSAIDAGTTRYAWARIPGIRPSASVAVRRLRKSKAVRARRTDDCRQTLTATRTRTEQCHGAYPRRCSLRPALLEQDAGTHLPQKRAIS